MQIRFDRAKMQMDDGGTWLCVRVKQPRTAREFIRSMQDKEYVTEPKIYRRKRSLTANAYLWVLCDKIGKAAKVDKEEVYKDAILHCGAVDLIDIRRDALPSFVRHWQSRGIGWICQKVDENGDFIQLAVYTGSSQYNTQEMSLIVDWIVQLAKDLEIETLPPDEIELMKTRWADA